MEVLPPNQKKYVYFFSQDYTEGSKEMRDTLGGKGANLHEMTKIGLPIPPGFTIITDGTQMYYDNNRQIPKDMMDQIFDNLRMLEKRMGKKLGDEENPLLLSVRSGAAISMPGMMDTILNLGLNSATVQTLANLTKNKRFALDSFRRFIHMFGTTVMDIKHEDFEFKLEELKKKKGVDLDTKLDENDLEELIKQYLAVYKKAVGEDFPENCYKQLELSIEAVFRSWNCNKSIVYRKLNNIKGLKGTAVNVMAMVFGNMGDSSGTGVAFTRDPSTGENVLMGEFLMNAQGEDVVAGIRTPMKIQEMKTMMPDIYQEFFDIGQKLEHHFRDMQDIEFTIQMRKLYILQCRGGKRTAASAIQIAIDMVNEGLISKEEAILRIEPTSINQLLYPVIPEKAKKDHQPLGRGLGASPGAAVGKCVFSTADAKEFAKKNIPTILVRLETSPEDIEGMNIAKGILTARGGMTSHAAVVCRGMGRTCVSGWADILEVSEEHKYFKLKNGKEFKEGDFITLNGNTGDVYEGEIKLEKPNLEAGNFKTIMVWADAIRKLKIRTNADTPKDADTAIQFGAEGIGLCRTEHMFFKKERIFRVRQMILSSNETERKAALAKLEQFQEEDFIGLFQIMKGRPVTIRLLDPPLHEFLPKEKEDIKDLAKEMGLSEQDVENKVSELHEFNPMLGHRGCRLGITFPEITEMQTRAILRAASKVEDANPEIMIPLVGFKSELLNQKEIVMRIHSDLEKELKKTIPFKFGTMIEVPRACVISSELAKEAEFYSFGTNDLTQMSCGFSRDDSAKFLNYYVDKNQLPSDPFQEIDREGVGEFMKMAIDGARSINPTFKIGICGEHGGEPKSIEFCHFLKLDYVSCSPYRVPIARIAAAQAAARANKKR